MEKKKQVIGVGLLIGLLVFLGVLRSMNIYAEESDTNKYNVVVVLDASNSMNGTDPNGYRYEAIGLFVNLLTEDGNYIGNVVFSNDISSRQDMIEANGQNTKDSFLAQLKETPAKGYTNIGKGLDTAVDMLLEQGDPELPYVILFLSDGNTEMPTDSELEESLEMKAEALQKARENGIQIYSVCLNANALADVTEMSQLADATGGQFEEVVTPEDLIDVFNLFYNMIYGTSTIPISDEVVPDNGIIEKSFELPSFGVEEVNIIIYGTIDNVVISNPAGEEIDSTVTTSSTYTIVKFSDIEAGTWKLTATGDPGSQIKINMVYNTDLKVNIASDATGQKISSSDPLRITASLESKGEIANQDYQYTGYTGTLIRMDSYRNEIGREDMQIQDGSFVFEDTLEEGTYYFKVEVTGNYLDKESEELGPVVVSLPAATEETEAEPETSAVDSNTPPVPVENPVKKTVYLIPFRDNEFDLDMTTLAKDTEDTDLHYEVVSSSFVENEDYTVTGNQIKVTNFSLVKGAFTIRAYDSLGEYCDIEVIITSINVGILTLLILAVIALIVLIVVICVIRYWAGKPFRGVVNVRSEVNGQTKSDSKKGRRGNIPLSRFDVDKLGLKKKTRFQATGKNSIYFIAKPGVVFQNQRVTKVEVEGNGSEYRFYVDPQDTSRCLVVSFSGNGGGKGSSGGYGGGSYGGGYGSSYGGSGDYGTGNYGGTGGYGNYGDTSGNYGSGNYGGTGGYGNYGDTSGNYGSSNYGGTGGYGNYGDTSGNYGSGNYGGTGDYGSGSNNYGN